MVVAGALYLAGDPDRDDYGFRKVLPPAMAMFGLLVLATPWLVTQYRLPALTEGKGNLYRSGSEQAWFWIGVAIAVTAGAITWAQRLDKSLWTDEVTSMRENIVGRWKHRNDDQGYLLRPSWADTFFEYSTPNNHALYSFVSRVTHERLVGVNETDFSRPYFNEPALRLPAFIAALLSLPLIGYLALRLGSLLAAWLAMSWAVLHPWYLEFSTSARGYTFAMCFLALSAVAAVRIFKCGGGWRWWVAYGLGQFLAFFSLPTVAHTLIFLNIAVFAGLLLDRSVIAKSRGSHLRAFFTANLVAAALAFVVFMPKHVQFAEFLDTDYFSSPMDWEWMEDCMSNFLTGQPYVTWSDDNPLANGTDQWPMALFILAIVAALAALAAAFVRSWRSGLFTLLFGLAIVLPPFTVYLQARVMQFYFLPWYSSFQMPLVLALFSIGAAAVIGRLALGKPKWVGPAATMGIILLLAVATHHERRAFFTMPVEQLRQAAATTRDSPNPFAPGHEDIITISVVTANHAYDPWNRRVRGLDDLYEHIAYAEESGKPLYCDTGQNGRFPDGCEELICGGEYFQMIGDPLFGLQAQNTRFVYKYIPGSLREKLAERAAAAN